ncbi:MAG: hypothetical protein OEZ32_01415 [Nitrospinota bacterium]|nr:hypothetical protein [Nitrospinota bacterium]
MTADAPKKEKRQSSSGLLLLLLAVAVAGAALMFRVGMGALEMSGAGMEHNKLLRQKTNVCSDRDLLDECARIMKLIEESEAAMMARERKEGASRP